MTREHERRSRPRLSATETDFERTRQRALLVGTGVGMRTVEEAEVSLTELAALADTAGADPVEIVLARRDAPDPATYIGSGKAAELAERVEALDIDVAIFDDELSPAQQRNLEKAFGVDVVDRVALILDIFAQHATSGEGMVQVELAQLRYRLPRLRGRGLALSQQAGGIGTRGPGETQLEVDRRRIQRRITKLERDLDELARQRVTQRKARRRRAVHAVALVGYTNAGKSTLLNRISGAEVLTEDRLFSTLDTTTRRVRLPGGETILASDTVGFVRRLPHQLVEAFRSTLEEVVGADLLVHVVDASSAGPDEEIAAVRSVLAEIGADRVPELLVFNKTDIAVPGTAEAFARGNSGALAGLAAGHSGALAVSARTGDGVDALLRTVGDRLRVLSPVVELAVPYARADVLAALHRDAEVLLEIHEEGGARVRVRAPAEVTGRFAEFAVTVDGTR